MTWQRDPLWAKSRLYFERALSHPREDPLFGLWCAFGLELLARAALAAISPTLLAEPDQGHRNLLHALNRGGKDSPRSIGTSKVLSLCVTLFPEFTDEDYKSALALTNRRNDELHSGAAAFSEYTTRQWITGFYGCCRSLTGALGETLEALLGPEEARIADEVLSEVEKEVFGRVQGAIAAHRRVFEERVEKERLAASAAAAETAGKLVHQRYHQVTCPSCQSKAIVQGDVFGPETVVHMEEEICIKQAVAPSAFSCQACHLRLSGYGELRAAGLGDQYTRTTTYTPEEYYGLIHPDDSEAVWDLVQEHLSNMAEEYDNE